MDKIPISSICEYLLSQDYLELYESAILISYSSENIKTYYHPPEVNDPGGRSKYFYYETLSKEIKGVINDLKNFLLDDNLSYNPVKIGFERSYGELNTILINRNGFIHSALKYGLVFHPEIQKLLGMQQLPCIKINQSTLITKFIGQWMHDNQPDLSVDEICNSAFLKRYGKKTNDKNQRTIRKDLFDAFSISKGEHGKKTYVRKPLKPLVEVVKRSTDSTPSYHFSSLNTIITITLSIYLHYYLIKNILDITVCELWELITNDETIIRHLDLRDESTTIFIKDFVRRLWYEEMCRLFPHVCNDKIPYKQQFSMTLRDLTSRPPQGKGV